MAYRHELKYLINYGDQAILRARMGALLDSDRHANERGYYTVRSLYFDDYTNSAYNDKYLGDLNRQKFRMRIYNGSDQVIQLERKIKWASYTLKQSARISRNQADEMLAGCYDGLLGCPEAVAHIFYHEFRSRILRPRVIVDYEREPYVMDAGSVRITFDMHVRAALGTLDIFDDRLATVEILDPGMLVMEVKFKEFLPSIVQRVLPQRAANYTAMSKYVMACDRTLHQRRADY